MKISILQYDIKWMDIRSNIDIITNHLSTLDKSIELLVLPEMFLTGFNMDAKSASISETDPAIAELISLATSHEIGIIGSLAICEEDKYYNRALLITNEGVVDRYDKQFRFTPSGESEHYSTRYPTAIFHYNGWKILPQVCYDLRFPENVRAIELPDLIIYMANWPNGRIYHWETLLAARAIENQCYTIGCNRIGTDDNGWSFPGHSRLVSFSGEVTMIKDSDRSLEIEVSKKELLDNRNKYPFWKDKRIG